LRYNDVPSISPQAFTFTTLCVHSIAKPTLGPVNSRDACVCTGVSLSMNAIELIAFAEHSLTLVTHSIQTSTTFRLASDTIRSDAASIDAEAVLRIAPDTGATNRNTATCSMVAAGYPVRGVADAGH